MYCPQPRPNRLPQPHARWRYSSREHAQKGGRGGKGGRGARALAAPPPLPARRSAPSLSFSWRGRCRCPGLPAASCYGMGRRQEKRPPRGSKPPFLPAAPGLSTPVGRNQERPFPPPPPGPPGSPAQAQWRRGRCSAAGHAGMRNSGGATFPSPRPGAVRVAVSEGAVEAVMAVCSPLVRVSSVGGQARCCST